MQNLRARIKQKARVKMQSKRLQVRETKHRAASSQEKLKLGPTKLKLKTSVASILATNDSLLESWQKELLDHVPLKSTASSFVASFELKQKLSETLAFLAQLAQWQTIGRAGVKLQ
ncbi:hypothetical protein ACHHYP_14964 [Achlya hypogyna]|uniref:Uncharacterized protein n=1 Tax=Achlya hypogyna TaxID=1202772 RepID=A0A1V9YBX1_ACHHY|nr:hypothetical protein ACHHYP_14964 [Achlya hypogyna]